MKIAMVCYPTFGGSGVVATELGLELAKKGHEIHFITYKQPVRLSLLNPNIYFHEVNVPNYPLFHYQPYELALSSKLVDMVKLYKIDVLHVHYAIPHAYAGYMAKQMLAEEGILLPMITTLHGTDITLVGNHPFYKSAVTFSINKSDFVTSVSNSLREATYRLFDLNKEIHVIPNFIEIEESNTIFNTLLKETPWQHDEIVVFGKKHLQPRLTALYGDKKTSLSYSNIKMLPHNWTPLLQNLKQKVETFCQTNFNVVLLNYYRNEGDGNGWHSDNENELGKNPTIASLSFGASRVFQMKHKEDKLLKRNLILEHGSLLVMQGNTQEFWKHQIPKSSKAIGPRINLTFRTIK